MKPRVSVDFSVSSTEELKNKIEILSSLSDFFVEDVRDVESLEFKISLNGKPTISLNAVITNQWGGRTTVKVNYVWGENLQRVVNYLRGYFSVWLSKSYDEKIKHSITLKLPSEINE